MRLDQRRDDILIVDELFAPEELASIARVAEEADFNLQELGRGTLPQRDRQRAVVDNPEVADLLWSKLEPLLPPIESWFKASANGGFDPSLDHWAAVGCNPRSRFYRYGLGGSFSPHSDEPWKPDSITRSMLTVLVYLPAGGCVGGETVVDGEVVSVVDGRVVVFEHSLLHEGKAVESGEKLVLRNDVVATVMSERLR